VGKFFLIAVGVVALIVFFASRGGDARAAFAKCVEKRGVVVGDSREFRNLYAGIGAYEGIAKKLDDRSISIRTPESEGLALVTGSESDARDTQRAFDEFLSGYTTQRAGNVVVAWSSGPDDRAAAAVGSCAE
jgi:hypothetical protein